MIAQLTGRIVARDGATAVLDVSGVGYEVHATASTLDGWQVAEDDIVAVIATQVREDAITLYGFATREERAAFLVLIGVNKVGAKLAMAALDALGLDGLRRAVETSDHARLCQISGVGKRTAQRLALELQGKLPAASLVAGAPAPSAPDDDMFALTLSRLGWGKAEIEAARDRVSAAGLDPDSPVADRVRAALRGSIRR